MNNPENTTNTFVPKQALAPTPALYDELVGDSMQQLAHISLAQIPSIADGAVVHDNGCGTGSGTIAVVEAVSAAAATSSSSAAAKVSIKATDINETALNIFRAHVAEQKWAFVDIEKMDANQLAFPEGTFDLAVGNALLFVLLADDGVGAVREMYRTLKPGGTMLVNSWAYNPNLGPVQAAAKATRPEGTPVPRGGLDKWQSADFVRSVVQKGGFKESKIVMKQGEVYATVPELTHFATMLWSFIGGTGEAGWLASDEENWDKAVETILKELRMQKGFTPLEGGKAKLRFVANIAVATK